jgi:hypothetical protein
MKMKLILFSAIMICAISGVNAQTSDAEVEATVNLLSVQKKEAVAQLINVSPKDSVTFWKIYDEYQASNKASAISRIRLYERTVQAYSNLTPALADSLAGKYLTMRSDQEKSLESYYKKVKAATNPILAFEFYQAEAYMLTLMRIQIMQQVPTYGQLEKAMEKQK